MQLERTCLPLRLATAMATCVPLSAVLAQTVVLPPPSAANNPMPMVLNQLRTDCGMFPGATNVSLYARTQILYDAVDVGASPFTISSISFRPPEFVLIGGPTGATTYTANVTVRMSNSPLLPSQATNDFTVNHGPTPVTVFSGPIALPERITGPWPAPWEAPLTFSTPFAYAGAGTGSLVVDIEVDNASSVSGFNWYVEWNDIDHGTVQQIAPGCELSSAPGTVPNVFAASPIVGGSFFAEYLSYPANNPNLAINLHLFGDALPSPVPVVMLGLPASSAGCEIGVDLLALDGLVYDATYGIMRMPSPLPIPNMSSLVGAAFSTQPATFESVSTGFAIHTGPAMTWTIGSGLGYAGATTVYQPSTAGNPQLQGVVKHGTAVTLRLN